jgi:hypothetical protein
LTFPLGRGDRLRGSQLTSVALTFALPPIKLKAISLPAIDWRALGQRVLALRPPRISAGAATSALVAALAYPATILGSVLIFAVCSQFALTLFATSISQFVTPITGTGDFNVPAPVQLADLNPAPTPKSTATPKLESSFTTVAPPTQATFTAVQAPSGARIGPSSVNLRSGPSNDAPILGVLRAGTPVTTSGSDKGWVMVAAGGQTGWIYSSFLEAGAITSGQ